MLIGDAVPATAPPVEAAGDDVTLDALKPGDCDLVGVEDRGERAEVGGVALELW